MDLLAVVVGGHVSELLKTRRIQLLEDYVKVVDLFLAEEMQMVLLEHDVAVPDVDLVVLNVEQRRLADELRGGLGNCLGFNAAKSRVEVYQLLTQVDAVLGLKDEGRNR